MGKVTSKYQVSIPKALADRLGVTPGSEVEWRVAGDEFRVSTVRPQEAASLERRLEAFDEATKRQALRNRRARKARTKSRGWTREDLYDRGRTR